MIEQTIQLVLVTFLILFTLGFATVFCDIMFGFTVLESIQYFFKHTIPGWFDRIMDSRILLDPDDSQNVMRLKLLYIIPCTILLSPLWVASVALVEFLKIYIEIYRVIKDAVKGTL